MITYPGWLQEILDAIDMTDGVDFVSVESLGEDEYIVNIECGSENFSFKVETDGENHGINYDGSIFEMTEPYQIQFWCACELGSRLQNLKEKVSETLKFINCQAALLNFLSSVVSDKKTSEAFSSACEKFKEAAVKLE